MTFQNANRFTMLQTSVMLLLTYAVVPSGYASNKAMVLAGVGGSVAVAGAAAGYSTAMFQEKFAATIGGAAVATLAAAWNKQLISGKEVAGIGAVAIAVAGLVYKNWKWNDTVIIKSKESTYEFNVFFKGEEQAIKNFCNNEQPKMACCVLREETVYRGKESQGKDNSDRQKIEAALGKYSYLMSKEEREQLSSESGRAHLTWKISKATVKFLEEEKINKHFQKLSVDVCFVVRKTPLKAGADNRFVKNLLCYYPPALNTSDDGSRVNDTRVWEDFAACMIDENSDAAVSFRKVFRETLAEDRFRTYTKYNDFVSACSSVKKFKKVYKSSLLGDIPDADTRDLLRALLREMSKRYYSDVKLPPWIFIA